MASLVRAVTENWKLKLLALTLAVLLWVVVSAEQVTSRWMSVPLRVHVDDPDYMLIPGSVPEEVQVRFTGPGREFVDLALRKPPLELSIDDVAATLQSFRLTPDMVRVPPQLSVNPQDVEPGAVTLNFVEQERRAVPVRVRVATGPGEGRVLLDSLAVRPQRITVSGPADRLREVDEVVTRPLSLAGEDSAFAVRVPVDTSALSGLQVSTPVVQVSGEVDRIVERTLQDVAISVGQGVAVRPERVSARLRGPQRVLQRLQPTEIRAVVSIDSIPEQIPREGIPVPVRVQGLPEGVSAEVTPASVQLLPAPGGSDTLGAGRPRGTPRPDRPGSGP